MKYNVGLNCNWFFHQLIGFNLTLREWVDIFIQEVVRCDVIDQVKKAESKVKQSHSSLSMLGGEDVSAKTFNLKLDEFDTIEMWLINLCDIF